VQAQIAVTAKGKTNLKQPPQCLVLLAVTCGIMQRKVRYYGLMMTAFNDLDAAEVPELA